jgi:hypothetical protein
MQSISGSYNVNTPNFLNSRKQIIENAQCETIKRLNLKFPTRIIGGKQLKFNKIEPRIFSNDSLNCKVEGLYKQAVIPGYSVSGFIVSFNYGGKSYNLHTKQGKQFFSDNLYFDPYPQMMLTHALTALSKDVNKTVTARNVELEMVKKARGVVSSFDEYQDKIKYFSQQAETVYIFKLTYGGKQYEYCLNSKGEPRHLEI